MTSFAEFLGVLRGRQGAAGRLWMVTMATPSLKWTMIAALGALVASGLATPAAVEWERLDVFEGSLSAAELEQRLGTVYAPHAEWWNWILITPEAAWLRTDAAQPNRYYRLGLRREDVPSAPAGGPGLLDRTLDQWHIAIDPGHIGGEWGPMEHRSFAIEGGPVVQEGDLVLSAARRLATALRGSGATVSMVRDTARPVTPRRPEAFLAQAERELSRDGDLPLEEEVRQRAEFLFYRQDEIFARSKRVNEEIRPHLVIALHLNAAPWKDPAAPPALVARNDGHIIVTGGFMPAELGRDEMRFAMLWRLLNGYEQVEIPLAREIAGAMVDATGLPPARYQGENAVPVGDDGYVWARNLYANRIYDAPVVYLEPWILNSTAVYPWAILGDYEGAREIGGRSLRSLPAVYADFVMDGIVEAIESRSSGSD